MTFELFSPTSEALEQYALLDDNDVLSAIKAWIASDDKVLSLLSRSFINRQLFRGELLDEPLTEKEANRIRDFAGYLFRFWEEIRRRIIEDIPGSCTEAQVSHVLSERFSRDPLGWSEGPLGKLVGVRVYLKDGGKLTKEAFRQGEELTERYSEYADRLIEEHIKGAVDFSIFETERPIFDGASGTQIRIRGIGMARDMIVH